MDPRVLIPLILVLGIITSYEDVRYGKIRNKWLFLSIGLLVVYYAVDRVLWSAHPSDFYLLALGNLGGAIAFGVALWLLRFWAAADAKLYIVFVALVHPLAVSHERVFFEDVLISTFVPLGIFLFCALLIRANKRQWSYCLRSIVEPRNAAALALYVFFILWPIGYLKDFAGNGSLPWILIGFALFMRVARSLTGTIPLFALVILCLLRLFFDSSALSGFSFFLMALSFTFALRAIYLLSGSGVFVREISKEKLREGMVAAEIPYTIKGKMGKIPERMYKKKYDLFYFFRPNPEGLSEKDIVALKKSPLKSLKIKESLSFAPFIFAGALITFFLEGNIVTMAAHFLINI